MEKASKSKLRIGLKFTTNASTKYDSKFPYLPRRIEKCISDTLVSYVDWEYNQQGQVVREDHSGSIVLWKYDEHGFPCQKTQVTGTDDPDVVSTYVFNHQGQCIQVKSSDEYQKHDYDLMGNRIASRKFSPAGTLLSAEFIGYDLNNAPNYRQTANPDNVRYYDYHASGLVKAIRQSLGNQLIAYTLYEYDPRGYLIEETDPRGYCTFREYDALGKVLSETKEGQTTHFSYEPGGLIETITSPSGGQTIRRYTTNGLPKEEIYPDGTTNSVVYDFLGRPIRETKNDLSWDIHYDGLRHRIVRTHLQTGNTEISEYDARGNLIRFTDSAGYTSEKAYDGLNRIKAETTSSGRQTIWSYQGDRILCSLPSGETSTVRYEGGQIVESQLADSQGVIIQTSRMSYDPESDREEVIQGDQTTVTWKNALGLPIKVVKGNSCATCVYDACGNCITSTDGDGRTTCQKFDGLGRLIHKMLPDGSSIDYGYDLDSNLIAYRLPNGNMWRAAYDFMHRKRYEELLAGNSASGRWEFVYENGYLKHAIDPMKRMHGYLYDALGRLTQDSVDGWQRSYVYDTRGLLTSAVQAQNNGDSSKVERSYDADGKLVQESMYLNSTLMQQTQQMWNPSGRTLQIGDHVRNFTYQNNRLVQVSSQNVHLSYTYRLNGSLKAKSNPLATTEISYNASALPENIHTYLPAGSYQENLEWYPSGKLSAYSGPGRQQQFSYNTRGYLNSAGSEKYDFDFGTAGNGVRTGASNSQVPRDGLDDSGKILRSIIDTTSVEISYNLMGEVISQNQRQFEWDPWGRLLQVTDPEFSWQAAYDALGRRLQTCYTQDWNAPVTTVSYYDPEDEFQEIGTRRAGKTFWKLYGPDSCDAISDETGEAVFLMHNALGQLAAVVSQKEMLYSDKLSSVYGYITASTHIPHDLVSCAQSLYWHSKGQDPTGLIWMGARYYDPASGRFLSPDPISYPNCIDLYAYANGDPINYEDLNGRFASAVYKTTKPVVMEMCQTINKINPAFQGFNALSTFCANRDLTRSMSFQVGSFDLPRGAIGFTNGVNNTLKDFTRSAEKLSQYAQGARIYGTYNATNTTPIDVFECYMAQYGYLTPPVQLLVNKWNNLIGRYGPNAKFLDTCHSGGALHVKNALLASPESVRKQIIVLAIAPAVIVPRKLCYESYNYISRRDFVTHLDFFGKMDYGNELIILEPDPKADFWDHGFLSPTFEEKIQEHILDYIDKYGR